jgi:hypothetical protein
LKNAASSSSMSVPFVWIVYSTCIPGRRYRSTCSVARRKKSTPIIVGSPPCQAIVTYGCRWASISSRMYRSSMSSAIRKRLPG